MPDDKTVVVDPAEKAQLDTLGNPAPKAPVAKEPVVLDAAAQAAADKAAAEG